MVEARPHHFYGRRKGRPLNTGRLQTLDQGKDILIPQIEQTPQAYFDTGYACYALEIGFGNGEHVVAQAMRNPDTGWIGCEAFINGVTACLDQATAQQINNLRIWADDALPLIQALPSASLDKVFLLFPDPWPKTKHHKRRFIQADTVTEFARVLKQGGILYLATDDVNLAQWMLLHTVQNDEFVWMNVSDAQWHTPPADWVKTRYQQKAAQQGRLGKFLSFVRR